MTFEFMPAFEQARRRIEAFWAFDVLDRPVVQFFLPKPMDEQVDLPEDRHATPEARWTDAWYQAELALATLSNQEFMAETLPTVFPNLGPEVFSGFYGCPLHFGDYGTSWSDPILEDWSQADEIRLDWDSVYLKKLVEMTDALLEVGQGKFITGMTDWHPGGDALAAFRDPQNLAMDLINHPDDVRKLLKRVETDYFAVYDFFYHKLRDADLPLTSWTPLLAEGRYYIPSNDFSIMVSKKMYDEFFLPGIVNECRFLDRSIYHLDGPGALRHLDSILAIPELNALQWVCGSGNEGFCRWVWVYQKAQAAGKGIQVVCTLEEIPEVMKTLDPRGLFLQVSGVPDRESGENMLRDLQRWTQERRKYR